MHRDQIQKQLAVCFEHIESDSIVIHPDLLKLGRIEGTTSIREQLVLYADLLVSACGSRTIMVPTFGYGFFKTGIYNVLTDPCQIGVLNEYLRQQHPANRTLTPVFNFLILNNRSFSLGPDAHVFAEGSLFGQWDQCKTTVLFFGASLGANTFIHHVEELMSVGYRYPKTFSGKIVHQNGAQEIDVTYRVKPFLEPIIGYDWERLTQDLVAQKILYKYPLGAGSLHFYRADCLGKYWSSRLQEDEFFLLKTDYKNRIQDLYNKFGRPLTREVVEAGWDLQI